MSREIDTESGTVTKEDALYLAQREQIPGCQQAREALMEDLDEEQVRRVLAGEADPDEITESSGTEEEEDEGNTEPTE